MRWKRATILACLVLVAGPVLAATYVPRAGMMLRFDESQQQHPKRLTVALPIMGTVAAANGGPLTFTAMYRTDFRMEENPRNSTGKVVLKIQVIRNDQVLWKGRKRSKIKYDRYTDYWECGNCTHNLTWNDALEGSLQEGDLVLFQFKFKKMPRFESGEFASLGGEVALEAQYPFE